MLEIFLEGMFVPLNPETETCNGLSSGNYGYWKFGSRWKTFPEAKFVLILCSGTKRQVTLF